MTRPLIRLSIVLALLCCVLISAVVLAGRLIPAPLNDSLIARSPCELPCFYGVTPGKTRYNGVFEALAPYTDAIHDSRDLGGFPFVDSNGNTAFVSLIFDNNFVVMQTRLWAFEIDANIGQLGDLLLTKWQPTHVYRTCRSVLPARFLLTFGTHDELLVELFLRDELTPRTPISLIDVSAGWRALDSARTSFGCTVETGWFGLAPLWKYFAVNPQP